MKKLKQLNDTYVACRFTDETVDGLVELQRLIDVPNPVPAHELHTTIVSSREYVPFPLERGNVLLATEAWLETWETQSGNALVLRFDSDYLQDRFDVAMCLGATYDFPDYKPHITLSYDVGSCIFTKEKIQIEIIRDLEYQESLDS